MPAGVSINYTLSVATVDKKMQLLWSNWLSLHNELLLLLRSWLPALFLVNHVTPPFLPYPNTRYRMVPDMAYIRPHSAKSAPHFTGLVPTSWWGYVGRYLEDHSRDAESTIHKTQFAVLWRVQGYDLWRKNSWSAVESHYTGKIRGACQLEG